jgi:DNA-binding response OmpR family regulator
LTCDGPSALDTLDAIQRLGERPPDFALLDLNLPNTDPIRDGREMMSRELGAAGCLRKPFPMESLLAMLRRHYTPVESGFSDRPAARR